MRRALPFVLAVACDKAVPPAPVADADAAPITTVALIDAAASNSSTGASTSTSTRVAIAGGSFGTAKAASRVGCAAIGGRHISEKDLRTSYVDGDDLLAIVNRSPQGQLPPDYAPTDMVDIRNGKPATPAECEKVHCLRKDAAAALEELMAEMKKQGFPGKVESAFRSYGFQCGTFNNWASKSTFCDATEQSALPGHSQHQLGTTLDLFTEEWAKDERGVFREGFGCTPAGRFIREHAVEYGFVMPYPIHPDDRHPRQSCVVRWDIPVFINPKTGYRFEHWHIRYVGKDAAARFEKARQASQPGTPGEITVEQWLRAEKGITGPDAELPVCDGCNCGACSTLAARGESACDKKGGALHLDAEGHAVASSEPPQIADIKKTKKHGIDVKLEVPEGVLTQTPIAVAWENGETFEKVTPYPATAPRPFAPIAGAWVVGVEPIPNATGTAWPWRAGISAPLNAQIYNRVNVLLPARAGTVTVRVPVPKSVTKVKVVLMEGGQPKGAERVIDLN